MKTGLLIAILCAAISNAPDVHVGSVPCVCDGAVQCAAEGECDCADITVKAEGMTFYYRDAHIVPSDFTVAEEIFRRRINAPLAQKTELVDTLIQKGADCKTAMLYCFPLLGRTVDEISRRLYVAPVDAEVKYRDGKYYVTQERSGRALDENRLYGSMYYSFKFFGGGQTVKAATVPIAPAVRAGELRQNLVLRGEYTTDYSTSSAARAHNVALAINKLDGVKVLPGATLSFNSAVGQRTEENGFKTAKIIVDGKYVDGVGGGVCQASTAVYNAALISGLNASANAHSICPSYCPPGLDAMISASSDLVITNTTDKPIYFSVRAGRTRATVRIYGAPCEYETIPESEIVKVLPCGEEIITDTDRKYTGPDGAGALVSPGKDGYESATYLRYVKDGVTVKRVKVRDNTYKPVPRVVAVAP